MLVKPPLAPWPEKFNLKSHHDYWLSVLNGQSDKKNQSWLLNALSSVQDEALSIEKIAIKTISATAIMKHRFSENLVQFSMPLYDQESHYLNSDFAINHWTLADIGRLSIIASALLGVASDSFLLLRKIYEYSDYSEKKSLTLGLYWLTCDQRLFDFAQVIQRSNVVDELAALTQHNPIISHVYNEHAFNQSALKAIFLGLNLDHIAGFQTRHNKDLASLCEDYLHERHLAERDIPASLWLGISIDMSSQETHILWKNALKSNDDEQRFYALKAIIYADARGENLEPLMASIKERQQVEKHPTILDLFTQL